MTATGPSGPRPRAGSSHPDDSPAARFSSKVPPPDDIVSGDELAEMLGVSSRTVREHAARGHVVRAGRGYAARASVTGYLDWLRIEAAKRGLGDDGGPLWKAYARTLAELREAQAALDMAEAAGPPD